MRVLITGGRDFDDQGLLVRVLDEQHRLQPITVIIHGDAKGADRLAGEWAITKGVTVEARPADWKRYGRAAGPMRNSQMLDEKPDLVIAFPGGKGTADMVKKARSAGLTVLEISSENEL